MCIDVGFAETKLFWPVVLVTVTSYQVSYLESHFPDEASKNEGQVTCPTKGDQEVAKESLGPRPVALCNKSLDLPIP